MCNHTTGASANEAEVRDVRGFADHRQTPGNQGNQGTKKRGNQETSKARYKLTPFQRVSK